MVAAIVEELKEDSLVVEADILFVKSGILAAAEKHHTAVEEADRTIGLALGYNQLEFGAVLAYLDNSTSEDSPAWKDILTSEADH